MARHGGPAHPFEIRQLAAADPRPLLDQRQQGGVQRRHARLLRLPPKLPRQAEQRRPQGLGEGLVIIEIGDRGVHAGGVKLVR